MIYHHIVYDDGCHLKRFVDGMYIDNETERLKLFLYKFVVDKLHIKGHTEKWCHENCSPYLFLELLDVKTVICEQINSWIGKYRYSMKHMNSHRFNFFLYILLNEYNKLKIDGKYNCINQLYQKTSTMH